MAITYVKDIPDFNKKVNELTDITDVKDDIEDIQEDITDIQGDITEIQGDVTTLAGAVTALDEEVDGLSASNLPYSSTQSTKEKIDSLVLQKGTTWIDAKWMFAGHITGSGNYVDAFVPFNVASDVSSISITAESVTVYIGSGQIYIPSSTNISILSINKFGFTIEIPFATAQTANIIANISMTGITITCS